MTWICPQCLEELGEYNAYCVYCKEDKNIKVFNPDKYYVREIRIYHISAGGETMTPQEELFAELFNHEKVLVKDMDILTLRAHREELAKIAFEARARLTAADDEERSRKKTNGKPSGFERSLNVDETATAALNEIKTRQMRLSKKDKILAGLAKLGIDPKHAEQLMHAGTILGRIKEKAAEIDGAAPKPEPKPIFNPFEKK